MKLSSLLTGGGEALAGERTKLVQSIDKAINRGSVWEDLDLRATCWIGSFFFFKGKKVMRIKWQPFVVNGGEGLRLWFRSPAGTPGAALRALCPQSP